MAATLVTGVDGFTGRYVAAALASVGRRVAGLSHRDVDLLDRVATARAVRAAAPEAVVHLAAIAFVAHGDADAMYRTNVVGTRNLLEGLARLDRKPRAVLLASSANVYGNTDLQPITEDAPLAPASDYGVSKVAMEYLARTWMDRLPITIVRPFNYTGAGQSRDFLVPKVVDHFRRRAEVIELGNLDVARDFSDVRTVAKRYVALLDANVAGETFNVASGRAYSLQEVLVMMRGISGHDIAVRVNPALVREGEVRRLEGSTAKLDAAIGPEPGFTLETTLRWMLESPA